MRIRTRDWTAWKFHESSLAENARSENVRGEQRPDCQLRAQLVNYFKSQVFLNRSREAAVMAKKNKEARSYVKLQSTESDHCYFTERNRRNSTQRLELRKYDPTLRKHVLYKEAK